MKTTLDLADDLLIEAKVVAARRRTTLKALIEHALRREIRPPETASGNAKDLIEEGPNGMLRLKSRGVRVTTEMVRQMMDEEGI